MFDPRKDDVFDRRGNLRTSLTFRFCGEVTETSIRQWVKRRVLDEEEPEQKNYSLMLSDRFGWQGSVYKRGWSFERLQAYQAKIPYGVTLIIEGDVLVRRGATYFNIDSICYPDGTPVAQEFLQAVQATEEINPQRTYTGEDLL